MACFVAALAFLFNGPSRTFNFPNEAYMIAIGNVLTGPAMSQLIVLSLPEMMNQANAHFPG